MLPCKSQTLSDGKVWNFVQRMYEHEDIERAYMVTVCGDTIANGLLCKKLVKVYHDTPNIQTAYAVFDPLLSSLHTVAVESMENGGVRVYNYSNSRPDPCELSGFDDFVKKSSHFIIGYIK